MKWVWFALFVCFAVPGMTVASVQRRARMLLLTALVATTVFKISVHFCSMETYRGPDRGFEVGVTDLIALSLAAGLLLSQFRNICWLPFNTPLLLAFFALACVSAWLAPHRLLASFTLWKLAKGYLLYWTVYNLIRIDGSLEAVWWGGVIASVCLTVTVFHQKYAQGISRTPGTFDHSNTIPAYSLLLIPYLLSWLMHKDDGRPWRVLVGVVGVLGLCFCVVATLSRAGAALMGGCVTAVIIYSLLRCPFSLKRTAVAAVFGVLMLAGFIKSYDSLVARFLYAPKSSVGAREEFNYAALMMSADHRLGVGLNCFSRVLTDEYRYRRHIRVMQAEEDAGVCHHIYLLTAAEMGWFGAAALVVVLLRFWKRLLRQALAPPDTMRSLLLGLAVGLAALHVIGAFEWVLRMTPVFNLFVIVTAVSVALAERLEQRSAQPAAAARRRLPQPSSQLAGAY